MFHSATVVVYTKVQIMLKKVKKNHQHSQNQKKKKSCIPRVQIEANNTLCPLFHNYDDKSLMI